MTVTINLTQPGFASIVTGVGACIVDALGQTPAGAPDRQCLLYPSSQIPWDACDCGGQLALAITNVYGSETFPAPANNLNWDKHKCVPRWWVAQVIVSLTRCLPNPDERVTPPPCSEYLAAALMLEDDRTAVRQAIACCLTDISTATPARLGAWSLQATVTLPESGGCGGTQTEFLLGVRACPCG